MGILYFTGLIKFSVQLIFAANYLKKIKKKKNATGKCCQRRALQMDWEEIQ